MRQLTVFLSLATVLAGACVRDATSIASPTLPPPVPSTSTSADVGGPTPTTPPIPATVAAPGTLPQTNLGIDATVLIQAVVAAMNSADDGQRTATALDTRDYRVISIGPMPNPEVAAIAQLDNTMLSVEIVLSSPPTPAQVAALLETVRQTGGDVTVAGTALSPGQVGVTTGATALCLREAAATIVILPATWGCSAEESTP